MSIVVGIVPVSGGCQPDKVHGSRRRLTQSEKPGLSNQPNNLTTYSCHSNQTETMGNHAQTATNQDNPSYAPHNIFMAPESDRNNG